MNKRERKAFAELELTRKYIKTMPERYAAAARETARIHAYHPASQPAAEAKAKTVKPVAFVDHTQYYSNIEIKKISKGKFSVKADGKMLDKTFKSITKAKEWKSLHQK